MIYKFNNNIFQLTLRTISVFHIIMVTNMM